MDKIYVIIENCMVGPEEEETEIWEHKYFQTKKMADKQCKELNKNAEIDSYLYNRSPSFYKVEELEVKNENTNR